MLGLRLGLARTYNKVKNWVESNRLIKEIIQTQPDCAAAVELEAITEEELARTDSAHYVLALDSRNRFVALRPDQWQGYFYRGAILQDLGRHPEAISDFESGLNLPLDHLLPLRWCNQSHFGCVTRSGQLAG